MAQCSTLCNIFWINLSDNKEDQHNTPQPHVSKAPCPTLRLAPGSVSYFFWAKPCTRGWKQATNKLLSGVAFTMHADGSASAPKPFRPPGAKEYPMTLQVHEWTQRDEGPGPWAREENNWSCWEEQRPPAVREITGGGSSEDHALPWGAHAQITTPEEHTRMCRYCIRAPHTQIHITQAWGGEI